MSEGLTTAFGTALATVQSDVLGLAEKALPYGLTIMGVFVALGLGIAFFKSIAK